MFLTLASLSLFHTRLPCAEAGLRSQAHRFVDGGLVYAADGIVCCLFLLRHQELFSIKQRLLRL